MYLVLVRELEKVGCTNLSFHPAGKDHGIVVLPNRMRRESLKRKRACAMVVCTNHIRGCSGGEMLEKHPSAGGPSADGLEKQSPTRVSRHAFFSCSCSLRLHFLFLILLTLCCRIVRLPVLPVQTPSSTGIAPLCVPLPDPLQYWQPRDALEHRA